MIAPLRRWRDVPVTAYEAARAAGDLRTQEEFWKSLLMRNGVYRTTQSHRMDDLLIVIVGLLREGGGGPQRVLDVACSSGIATVELHRALAAAEIESDTVGTDLVLHARAVRRDDDWTLVFDPAGEVIRIEHGGWASPWRWRPRDRVLHPSLVARARQLVASEAQSFRDALVAPQAGLTLKRVPLLSSLTDGVPGVRFVEEDLRNPQVAGTFGLIRAANILNRDYFDEPELRSMAAGLRARLAPGGLLVIGRSEGRAQRNRATFFRSTGEHLEVVATTNGGSEVTALVLD